jgi:hypothetical protein
MFVIVMVMVTDQEPFFFKANSIQIFCGRSLNISVNRVLLKILTYDVLLQYTWTGKTRSRARAPAQSRAFYRLFAVMDLVELVLVANNCRIGDQEELVDAIKDCISRVTQRLARQGKLATFTNSIFRARAHFNLMYFYFIF